MDTDELTQRVTGTKEVRIQQGKGEWEGAGQRDRLQ